MFNATRDGFLVVFFVKSVVLALYFAIAAASGSLRQSATSTLVLCTALRSFKIQHLGIQNWQ